MPERDRPRTQPPIGEGEPSRRERWENAITKADEMPLVMIEWEDSHSSGAWEQIGGEIEDRALVCRSVGWLVLDGERAKVIAPHKSDQEPGVPLQASGVMTIPARSVLSITALRPAKRPRAA